MAREVARLTALEVDAWIRRGEGDTLNVGDGVYLRRRGDNAYWAIRQMNAESGNRTWVSLFPSLPYPRATLAEARKRSEAARKQDGAPDLATQRRQARRESIAAAAAREEAERVAALEAARRVTVRELFERWVATDLQPRIGTDGRRTGRKDGGAYTRAQFERRVFPVIGHVPVTEVRKSDVMAILDDAKAAGRLRTANVILSDLKQMMRFALARDLIDRDPLATVTKRDAGGAHTMRERELSAELGALVAALPSSGLNPRSVAAVWLILATGCRVGELMSARWDHVDLGAATWHLPTTKNQREHLIHLSPFALRWVRELADMREADKDGKPLPWLFPNSAGTGPVDIKSFGKQLSDRQREPERRLQGRSTATMSLALPGGRWTAHDLRRTAATVMARLGISGDVIDECLNHVIESRVRRTYIRDRRLADQARALDALGQRLAEVFGDGAGGNVIPLRAA